MDGDLHNCGHLKPHATARSPRFAADATSEVRHDRRGTYVDSSRRRSTLTHPAGTIEGAGDHGGTGNTESRKYDLLVLAPGASDDRGGPPGAMNRDDGRSGVDDPSAPGVDPGDRRDESCRCAGDIATTNARLQLFARGFARERHAGRMGSHGRPGRARRTRAISLRTSSASTGRARTRERRDAGISTSICASLGTKAKRRDHRLLLEAPLTHVVRGPDEEPGPRLVSLVRLDEEPASVREEPRRRPVGVGVQDATRHPVVRGLE
jgi:hypothetical protein